jgi:hypothetical protein
MKGLITVIIWGGSSSVHRGTKAKMLCPAMRKSLKINVNVI